MQVLAGTSHYNCRKRGASVVSVAGELQPRDGVDGLRRVRPAVLRRAQPRARPGHLQEGEPQGRRRERWGTGQSTAPAFRNHG